MLFCDCGRLRVLPQWDMRVINRC